MLSDKSTNTFTARLDNAADELYRNHLNHVKDLAPEMGRISGWCTRCGSKQGGWRLATGDVDRRMRDIPGCCDLDNRQRRAASRRLPPFAGRRHETLEAQVGHEVAVVLVVVGQVERQLIFCARDCAACCSGQELLIISTTLPSVSAS